MQPIHQLTDAELIYSYQSGNSQAFETLIHRYKDKVFTTIFMLVKDRYLAEDIFQEAFLKMIRTIKGGNYSEQGKFLPWAIRVAHNLCMDHFRKVRLNVRVTLPDGRDLSDLIPSSFADDAAHAIERRQTHASVRELIEQLPDEQREVIAMRMYADQSFKEIADFTGVSINTALGRMRYALINLRRMINEQQLVLR